MNFVKLVSSRRRRRAHSEHEERSSAAAVTSDLAACFACESAATRHGERPLRVATSAAVRRGGGDRLNASAARRANVQSKATCASSGFARCQLDDEDVIVAMAAAAAADRRRCRR